MKSVHVVKIMDILMMEIVAYPLPVDIVRCTTHIFMAYPATIPVQNSSFPNIGTIDTYHLVNNENRPTI